MTNARPFGESTAPLSVQFRGKFSEKFYNHSNRPSQFQSEMSENSESEKQKSSTDEEETEMSTDEDDDSEDDDLDAGREEEDDAGGLFVSSDVVNAAALDVAKRARQAHVMTPAGNYAAMRYTGDVFSVGKWNPWDVVNPMGVHPHDPEKSIFAYDLSKLEDTVEAKPWTAPGADITQWFNYGFTEHTWEKYRKKMLKVIKDKNFEKEISVFVDTQSK